MCLLSPPIGSRHANDALQQSQSINHQMHQHNAMHVARKLQLQIFCLFFHQIFASLHDELESFTLMKFPNCLVFPQAYRLILMFWTVVGSWTHKKKKQKERKKFFVFVRNCGWSLDHDDDDAVVFVCYNFMLQHVMNTSIQILNSHGWCVCPFEAPLKLNEIHLWLSCISIEN